MHKGIAASRGIGIGSICVIVEHELKYDAKKIEDVESEKKRFQDAVEEFKRETAEMAEDIRKRIGPKEAEILEGHLVMMSHGQKTTFDSGRILQINPRHPLIHKLSDMTGDMADDVIHLLYDQALLAEGEQLPDPAAFNKRLTSLMMK